MKTCWSTFYAVQKRCMINEINTKKKKMQVKWKMCGNVIRIFTKKCPKKKEYNGTVIRLSRFTKKQIMFILRSTAIWILCGFLWESARDSSERLQLFWAAKLNEIFIYLLSETTTVFYWGWEKYVLVAHGFRHSDRKRK